MEKGGGKPGRFQMQNQRTGQQSRLEMVKQQKQQQQLQQNSEEASTLLKPGFDASILDMTESVGRQNQNNQQRKNSNDLHFTENITESEMITRDHQKVDSLSEIDNRYPKDKNNILINENKNIAGDNNKKNSKITQSHKKKSLKKEKYDAFSQASRKAWNCFGSSSVFWIYMSLVTVIGIVSFSVCIAAGSNLSSLEDSEASLFAMETLSIWFQKLILDIVSTKADYCPQGYEEGIDNIWSGTVAGCACPYSVSNKQQMFLAQGQCNDELLKFSCKNVIPNDEFKFDRWRSGMRFCVKRDQQSSFFNSPTSCVDSSNSGYVRSCGMGQTAVCRLVNEGCPVSYLNRVSSTPTIVVSSMPNTKILEIDSSVSFAFETQSSHYPVAGFRLDEYSHCEHITQKQISLSKKGDYILLKNSRTFCTVSDSRPVQLDTLGEEALFKANAALWALIMTQKKLPAYPRPSDSYKWVLSSMPYPPWTMSCRATYRYSMPQVKERFELSTEIYNQTHLISTTSISLFVVSLLLIVVSIRRKCIRMADVKYYKAERFFDPRFNSARFGRTLFPREKGWVKTTLIITAIHWIFRFLNLPSIFISLERIKDSIDWFSETLSLQCGDTFYSTNIAGDYKDKLSQLRDFYAVMVGFWWTLFVIDILYAIFTFFYEILPALEEERLTELIVKNTTDKQDLSPEMVGTYKKQIPFPHQQPIIEEEGFDEDQLYDEVKKR